jgi:hypothetical protein
LLEKAGVRMENHRVNWHRFEILRGLVLDKRRKWKSGTPGMKNTGLSVHPISFPLVYRPAVKQESIVSL